MKRKNLLKLKSLIMAGVMMSFISACSKDNSDSDVGYIRCPECKNYIRGDAYFTKTNSQYRTFNKKI